MKTALQPVQQSGFCGFCPQGGRRDVGQANAHVADLVAVFANDHGTAGKALQRICAEAEQAVSAQQDIGGTQSVAAYEAYLRGQALYDLGAELGYRTIQDSYDGGVVLLTTQEDGSRSALVVDLIMEQRQVVIKGLQQSYGNIPGVAAATILGDGQIALILDPADLVTNATGRTRNASLPLAG